MNSINFTAMTTLAVRVACVVASLWATGVWTPAQAQSAPTTTITAPVSGNIYAAGGSVQPSALVDGDFVAAGGRVLVDRAVKGDVTLAGGSVVVRAPVGDDVRAVGGDVRVESAISGEVFIAAGSVVLTKEALVAKSATLYGGNVTVDGKIDGPLKIAAQKVFLNGQVLGDVRLYAEQIELGPTAKIGGSLHYPASVELKKAEGAMIAGAITRAMPADNPRNHMREREWHMGMPGYGPMWAGAVFTFFALLACAAIVVAMFPVFWKQAANNITTSAGQAAAVGFATLLVVPLLAGLLFITVLGIPLGIMVMMLYPALLLAGYLVGVYFIAQRAQAAFRKDAPSATAISIGMYALTLLAVMLLAGLPLVGPLALLVITILGTGACVLEFNRLRNGGAAPPNTIVKPGLAPQPVGAQ